MLRALAIFLPAGLCQHIDQRVPCQPEIRHRHPGKQAADGKPHPVSFCTKVMNRQRHRQKTDQDVQSLGNEGRRSSDAGAAIPFASAAVAAFGEHRLELLGAWNGIEQCESTGFEIWCGQSSSRSPLLIEAIVANGTLGEGLL